MADNKIDKDEKLSKKQFLNFISEMDNQTNEQLKSVINSELQKDFDSIDWKKVADCMQVIIAIRSDDNEEDIDGGY